MATNVGQVGQGAAFDSAEYCLNQTRAITNDVMESQAGDILTDDWPSTWTYLNIAQRMCQEYLSANGVETNRAEIVLANLPPVANSDPATQVWLSQSGYYDGEDNHETPALPADIVNPLRVWTRFAGTQNPFFQVAPAKDGIDGYVVQIPYPTLWEWRSNILVFCGFTQNCDIRLRYNKYFADLTGPTSVIAFPRMTVALAYMTAYVFANARGDASAAGLKGDAYDQLDNIVTSSVRQRQRRGVSRRPYGGFGGRRNVIC
jgi:hypothetical protein